jgi:hypothetical protein
MVMDDILVNFDSKRARAAAELLVDFSKKGYQLLMFTCHEHMRDMFHSLHVNVKVLPHHKDVVESSAIPMDFGGARPQVVPVPKPAPAPAPMPSPAAQISEPIISRPVIPQPVIAAYQTPPSGIAIDADEYDPELEYELSAVADDQQRDIQLRHELIYVSPNYDDPIDISGDHEIWQESSRVVS